ncbi:MAG: choice-of-anchor V domain-containing protein [Bacteroidota bacterium]|jgi:hypothetical protein
MKKHVLALLGVSLLGITYSTFSNQGSLHSSSTGAPGAGTCTNCHGGSNQSSDDVGVVLLKMNGTTMDTIPATEYEPGQTYAVFAGAGESFTNQKFGFSLTASAGTLSTIPGNNEVQKSGNYLTHTGTGTVADEEGGKAWAAMWQAPANASGAINFQFHLNASNNDNSTSGDNIYASTATLTAKSTGVKEIIASEKLSVYPNPAQNSFFVDFELANESNVSISLFGADGKLIKQLTNQKMNGGTHSLVFNPEVKPGLYLVNIVANNQTISKRLIIQ